MTKTKIDLFASALVAGACAVGGCARGGGALAVGDERELLHAEVERHADAVTAEALELTSLALPPTTTTAEPELASAIGVPAPAPLSEPLGGYDELPDTAPTKSLEPPSAGAKGKAGAPGPDSPSPDRP